MHNLTGRVKTLNFVSSSFISTLLYHFFGLTSAKVWWEDGESSSVILEGKDELSILEETPKDIGGI